MVCRGLVERYLGRAWTERDGLPEKEIKKAEARLGIKLPPVLREFHLSVGSVGDFRSIHTRKASATERSAATGKVCGDERVQPYSFSEN